MNKKNLQNIIGEENNITKSFKRIDNQYNINEYLSFDSYCTYTWGLINYPIVCSDDIDTNQLSINPVKSINKEK